LHFSAYEYLQWEKLDATEINYVRWQRKRPIVELLGFFDRLMNIKGTAVNEAVLEDPETIEWMASLPESRGSNRPPIFGHTEERELMMTAIEAQVGKKIFSRPLIKGLALRTQRKVIKTKDAVAAGQARNKSKRNKGT
jgi:hypothetical protein